MKYRITKHGQKLWHTKQGTVLSESEINERMGDYLSIGGAIELGLLEHGPERIELIGIGPKPKLTVSQWKTLEHAINGEWDKISGCLEWVYELYYDYKENGENYDNFDHYLDRIKANK